MTAYSMFSKQILPYRKSKGSHVPSGDRKAFMNKETEAMSTHPHIEVLGDGTKSYLIPKEIYENVLRCSTREEMVEAIDCYFEGLQTKGEQFN